MRPVTKILMCYSSSCFLSAAALYTLIYALNSVAVKPRLYVQELYVPSLVNSTGYNSSSFNTSIFMELKFKRESTFTALSYVHLNITLFYSSNRSSVVGYYLLPGFAQGHRKTARRSAVVEGSRVPWEDAVRKVSGGSTVGFTVAVAAEYRVERCGRAECRYGRATAMAVEADVEVDGSGRKGPNLVYIQDLYIPALDTTNITSRAGNGTTSIFVDLKYQTDLPAFSDPNEESDLVVVYGHGITAVGGSRVEAFGMGGHTKVHKMVVVEAPELPWEEAIRAVSAGLTLELEIQLRNVRNGRALMRHVAVDASGHMVLKGPVELF